MLQNGTIGSNLAGSFDNVGKPLDTFSGSDFEKRSSVPARGGLSPGIARRIREYIATHLESRIENETLAFMAGLSVCHFSRAFKQSLGTPPRQYVLKCRVERAKDLLASTELSLSEVAIASGFADQSHFCRCFRDWESTTPSHYRWSRR